MLSQGLPLGQGLRSRGGLVHPAVGQQHGHQPFLAEATQLGQASRVLSAGYFAGGIDCAIGAAGVSTATPVGTVGSTRASAKRSLRTVGVAHMAKRSRWIVGALVAAIIVPVPIGRAEAGPPACENRNNNTIDKLLECVTLAGVREHQQAFQADRRRQRWQPILGAARATTRPSTTWCRRLRAAGYNPVVQPFDYLAFTVLGPSALQQTAPGR